MLRLIDEPGALSHRCHETRVGDVMTRPVVAIQAIADFRDILDAFRHHGGRTMPVVDSLGQVIGLLVRKDFLSALARDIPL